MNGTAGKVALVNNTTTLNGACPAGLIDLVGYGSTANCSETSPTAALSNTTAAKRNTNGCTETDNNNADFVVSDPTVSPTPRNTASPLNSCGGGTPNLTINNVTLAEGNAGTTTFTFTVSLSAAAPAGGVTFDIATADGTATTADNDYAANSVTGQTIAEGNTTATFAVTVKGDSIAELDETFFVNVTNAANATITDGQGVGTITNDDNILPALSINNVTLAEGNAGTTTFTFTVSLSAAAPAGGVTFDIATADGTATTADNDYAANSATGQTIAEGNTTATFAVTVKGDSTTEPDETFFVNVTNAANATITDGQGVGTITNDEILITPIYTIQGSGPATLLSGTHTTEGIVIGDYEGSSPALGGFYIQDITGDGNTATSDGLFIYNGGNNNVVNGDLVRVTGTVGENFNQTQISNVTNITVLGSGNTPTPTDISLPFDNAAEPEQYEGMLVRFSQNLYVTEHYLLGRFGQVTLSGTGRLYQPTSIVSPGAPALAMQAANDLNKIILDDASQAQNPDPILFGRGAKPLSASNTLRGGDIITGLVGVFTYTWGGDPDSPDAYRLRPVNALGGGIPNFVAANGRPSAPDPLAGPVKVAGMNLLNYFNTFDDGNSVTPGCYPGGGDSDCRGAESAAEFTRQSDKTVNAILAMNVDVIGIVEIENDGYGPTSAIQDLVDKLNAVAGAGAYAFIDADARTGKINALGADAIKVGFLYKPATITPVGATAVLDTVAFVNGGDSSARNRVSLLQAFQTTTGGRFIASINHLKSKGSACDNPDTGDGQGNCAIVRANAATELKNWIATNPTGISDPDVIILGDLNSYAMEDPIAILKAAGYTNMVNHFGGARAYSYVFDGQWGSLDYALGSASLLAQVGGVTEFHINADEPSVLDYNTNYKTAGQIINLYSTDPFRASDHDPIIVGLNPGATAAPILTLPANMTVEAASAAGAVVNFVATATDAVDPAPIVACLPPSGSTFPPGLTTVNCTATTASGNTANGSFTITVQDTTDPILTLPANMTVEAASAAGAIVNFAATATDAVDATPNVACLPPSGSTFPPGLTTVNCTAADDAGNAANGSFTITVVDTTDPVLTLPANMSVEATSAAGAVVNFVATATDAVDATPTVACLPPSGSTFPPGLTTVNCTAADDAGNVANGSFTITVMAPAVSLGATSHDFGYQAVGTTSRAFAFTVTNTGTANLVIGTLGVTGQFALDNNLCNGQTLAPSRACTFGAAFSPLSIGAKAGAISIPSNAASSPNRVSLNGTGHTALTATFTSLGTNDGYIIESGEDTSAGGTANATGGIIMVGDHLLDRQVRSLLHFNTDSLPDDAVVTGITIKIKQQMLFGNPFIALGNLQVDIAKPYFGAKNSLTPADFQAAPRASNVGFFNPIPATGNWYSANLNPAAFPFLNRAGNTQFRLAFSLDDDDDRKINLFLFNSGDFLAAYRPMLIVTYYIP